MTQPFDASDVLAGKWKDLEDFDLFAFHAKWNYPEVKKVLPDGELKEEKKDYFLKKKIRTTFFTHFLKCCQSA